MAEAPEFRRLTLVDLDAVLDIEERSFSVTWSRESYIHELTDNELARYYGLFCNGRLAAFLGYWLIPDEAHITNVATHPDFRRQGLAEYLLRRAACAALAEGGEWLTLEVRSKNVAAIALYEKLGFTVEGRRQGYYDEPKDDALIMWGRVGR